MQSRSTLPPAHPSLPAAPTISHVSYSQPQAQPYGYPTYVSSHYAQAYAQSALPVASPAGYYPTPVAGPSRTISLPVHTMSSWYQPGNNRCSHPGCTFSGSQKTVETHMMDRHLIYPPGWEKRKKRQDWDADPSLKGKPVPIQGTNVILDTPEVLEAWIAERKKRFPSAVRVEEKKRKMDEAIARGQLDLNDTRRPNKRQKVDGQRDGRDHFHKDRKAQLQSRPSGGRERNVNSSERPGPSRARASDSGWPKKPQENKPVQKAEDMPVISDDSDTSCDEDAPEAISSKVPPLVETTASAESKTVVFDKVTTTTHSRKDPPEGLQVKRNAPLQPRPPPRNPFASRPTLLRNLLLPEIRVTVSNLSQAIRFLVDNDFLRDVELKPGQAAEQQKIEVLERMTPKEL